MMLCLASLSADDVRPGRPRDKAIDSQIVDAVFGLIEEVGLGAVTIDAIAERAGVSKATIYRRWESKDELIVDSVAGLVGDVDIPKGDDIRSVLLHAIQRMTSFMTKTTAGVVFPWLVGEIARDSDLGRRYAEAVIIPGRTALARHVSEAIEQGELRSDLDVPLAVDMLMGPLIITKLMGAHRRKDPDFAEKLVDTLLLGWRADQGSSPTHVH